MIYRSCATSRSEEGSMMPKPISRRSWTGGGMAASWCRRHGSQSSRRGAAALAGVESHRCVSFFACNARRSDSHGRGERERETGSRPLLRVQVWSRSSLSLFSSRVALALALSFPRSEASSQHGYPARHRPAWPGPTSATPAPVPQQTPVCTCPPLRPTPSAPADGCFLGRPGGSWWSRDGA